MELPIMHFVLKCVSNTSTYTSFKPDDYYGNNRNNGNPTNNIYDAWICSDADDADFVITNSLIESYEKLGTVMKRVQIKVVEI